MPWSVQIYGNVFIHDFTSVPNYPASHGCIRVPLDGGNPAKFFYELIDNGSPVRVVRNRRPYGADALPPSCQNSLSHSLR